MQSKVLKTIDSSLKLILGISFRARMFSCSQSSFLFFASYIPLNSLQFCCIQQRHTWIIMLRIIKVQKAPRSDLWSILFRESGIILRQSIWCMPLSCYDLFTCRILKVSSKVQLMINTLLQEGLITQACTKAAWIS